MFVKGYRIFYDGDFIGLDHLPEYMRLADAISSVSLGHGSLKDAVKGFEQQFIQQTLAAYGQNKEAVAKVLGVSLSSPYRKIEELQVPT